MKIILFGLLLLSGCSTIDVYPLGNFVDLSKSDLVKESKKSLKESKLDDNVPSTKKERNEYFISLESSIPYRNYLFIECLRILQNEHSLDLTKPVFASLPRWNNAEKWYVSIFNFHATVDNFSKIMTMECDEVVNDNKEVVQYQIIKSNARVLKDQ